MSNPSVRFPTKKLLKEETRETQSGFDRLLIDRDHQKRVERIARKHTRGTTLDWEDAAQTAHIKVLHAVNSGKFRCGGSQEFYRWAATVARFEIIDLVRKDKQRCWQSLDQPIVGTDLFLLDTIADDFNLLDTIERSDLLLKALEMLDKLDRQHPDRDYLKLWQGRVQEKTQTQISAELGLTQGAVSKRWKEMIHRLSQAMDLLQDVTTKQEVSITINNQSQLRKRSEVQW
jgi:RNA polymerase sporulation-specific sigma factor